VSVADLREFFNERFAEIDSYLSLLQGIEDAANSGSPRITNSNIVITATQQKILYSSVYLQLYNLVEATISRCIETVCEAAASHTDGWRAADLNESLRREWVRAVARTHMELTPDHRLESALALFGHLIDQLPIREFRIDIGGGGNWDDEAIEKVSARVGCQLRISPEAREGVKRPERDDMGAMKLIKNRRNNLAHGSVSFVDCADGIVVEDLRRIAHAVASYLREAINCFSNYIDVFEFLLPGRRPSDAA
jgi:hypothetical protein